MKPNRISVYIKTASIAFDKISNPILAQYDLTASQCRVLRFLYTQPNRRARVVDIEKECAVTHPTVLGLLNSLEKKGFLAKTVNPMDARSKLISLTEKALAKQAELEGVVEQIDDLLTKNLSEQEKTELVRLLQKLLQPESEAAHIDDSERSVSYARK